MDRKQRGLFKAVAVCISFLVLILFGSGAFASPGFLDYSFGTNGLVKTDLGYDDQGSAVAVYQSGVYAGKIVVAGTVAPADNAWNSFAVARYDADGSLDTSFGTSPFYADLKKANKGERNE